MTPTDAHTRRELLGKGALVAAGLLGGSALLAACGSDTKAASSVAADPKKLTGTLNFVNFEGWIGKNTTKAFEAKFPGAKLKQIPVAGTQDQWLPKVKDRRGDYDLALADGVTLPRLLALDAVASFTPQEVPNQANIDPAFRGQPWDPDNKYFLATDYGRTAIGYRKDLVDEEITSYEQLFSLLPKYSGKVALLSRMGSTLAMALIRLGHSVNSTDPAEIDEAKKLLISSKKHLLALADSASANLLSADAVIALGDDYDIFTATTKNPNVVWVDPTEGMSAYLEGFVALKGPREDLAKAFINFQADPVQNADFVNTLNIPSVVPKAASLISPKIKKSTILFPSEEVRKRVEFFAARTPETEKLWMTAWDEFRAA